MIDDSEFLENTPFDPIHNDSNDCFYDSNNCF